MIYCFALCLAIWVCTDEHTDCYNLYIYPSGIYCINGIYMLIVMMYAHSFDLHWMCYDLNMMMFILSIWSACCMLMYMLIVCSVPILLSCAALMSTYICHTVVIILSSKCFHLGSHGNICIYLQFFHGPYLPIICWWLALI